MCSAFKFCMNLGGAMDLYESSKIGPFMTTTIFNKGIRRCTVNVYIFYDCTLQTSTFVAKKSCPIFLIILECLTFSYDTCKTGQNESKRSETNPCTRRVNIGISITFSLKIPTHHHEHAVSKSQEAMYTGVS